MQGQGTADRGQGLRLPQTLYGEVIAHCLRHHPKEACGYLAGRADGVVQQVYPMTNVEDSSIGYSLDPKEQLQVERAMRQRGQRMVAVYHSHTASDAYPSSVDVSLAISPDISYVLVSLKDRARPVVRSFRIDGLQVAEEPVTVSPEPTRR
ncbi:MAG: M67 family metallopeptidase [Candidatus Omnitrophica bacterium]|nr:M67 family metallopeptidase [Candidatus Omnitrophota bacterium]